MKRIISKLLGRIMAVLSNYQREYEISKLKRTMNCKGDINGSLTVQYPENIFVGKDTYINGGGVHCVLLQIPKL